MPTNSRYQKKTIKLLCAGFTTVTPGDLAIPGKFRKLSNARVRRAGVLTARPGTAPFNVTNPGFATNVHSIKKFYSSAGSEYILIGEGLNLKRGSDTGAWVMADTGYSGKPMSIVVARPRLVGDIWGYAFDTSRQRKVNTTGATNYPIGLPIPGRDGNTNYDTTPAGAPTHADNGVGNLNGTYNYKYRYRNLTLGVRSNPSAASADFVGTNRQTTVTVTVPSNDGSQATTVDIFRIGGTITTYRFVGSITLPAVTFDDNVLDSGIASADVLDETLGQPWVTTDASSVTRANKPLPHVWGPFAGVLFAVGDTDNPGYLYWTNPNDPDTQDVANYIEVTGANEPLVNGFIYGGKAFVWSHERLFAIYQSTSGITSFEVLPTACGRGIAGPHAFAVGDRIYFGARDGIFATAGGNPEQSLTSEVYNMFQHEGDADILGTVEGVLAPDIERADTWRLNYRDGILWFDYRGKGTTDFNTWVYDFSIGGWFPDVYSMTGKVIMHYATEGEDSTAGLPSRGMHLVLMGLDDGGLFKYQHGFRDNTLNYTVDVWPPLEDFGDPRAQKLWGDTIVELDRADLSVVITPVFDNDSVVETATTVSSGSGRQTIIISHNSGSGRLARNMGLRFSWVVSADDATRDGPHLFAWHPSAIVKPDESILRAMEWHPFSPDEQDAYVWGIDLWIDTEGSDVVFEVHRDGSASGVTFTANATGERKLRFSWHATNFEGRLGKLLPQAAETDNWRLSKWEWLYNKMPIESPDFDSGWTSPMGEGQTMYVTGVQVKISTGGSSKALVFQSELEGTIAVQTARETNAVASLGNEPKTFTRTFEPFRASMLRVNSVDGVDARFHWAKWFVKAEPTPLANWDSTYEDLGKPHLIKGVEIYADTLSQNKSVQVQLDGVVHTTLTVNQGRIAKTYVLPTSGSPAEFPIASTVRLFPINDVSDVDAYFYRVRWLTDEYPDLVTNWDAPYRNISKGGQDGILKGIMIEADTAGAAKTVQVQVDRTTVDTLTVNFSGRQAANFPIVQDSNGEYPRGKVVRLMPTDANVGRLFTWEPIAELEPPKIANWNPVWDNAGRVGAKFVQGMRITADTQNLAKTVNVEYTDTTGTKKTNGLHAIQFPIRDTKVISFATPFIAHNLRLVPSDANAGWMYGVEWIWEKAPDLATTWTTQELTYGLAGWFHDRDAFIAISDAPAAVSLIRTIDGTAQPTITIPITSGFAKHYVTFAAAKGKSEKWALTSTAAFRLFRNASEVRVKPWGDSGAYKTVLPFGDVHAEFGAKI